MTVPAKQATVVLLPGDGVGPEVIAEAQRVLELVAKVRAHKVNISFKTELIGGASIDAHGTALTDDALASCKAADAILLGAVGGPKWATGNPRPEQGLLALRKSLDLYANLRPCTFASDALISHSPLKESIVKGVDFMMIRELVGGIYFGDRKEATEEDGFAYDTLPYSKAEVERVTRLAAALALQHEPHWPIHSIDKANVLASSRLWRKTVTDVIEKEYPQLKVDHHLVDSAAMFLVKNPRGLNGVILTENMFGDILSDEASVIPGSLGLLPSASLNGLPEKGKPCLGVYEPIHGSAPDIAGKGIANPVGTILSAAMLLRYSLDMEAEAVAVEDAVRKVLDGPDTAGYEFRTRDLGGDKTTKEMGDKILEVLEKELFGLNAAEGAPITRALALGRPAGRRGMTISEKIIAHNAIGLTAPGNVKPGDMVCVSVDWTLASELTWK
ncbi:3-isopropylmalate dehydrogenase, partial [Linnemannia gamsii]